MENEEIKQETEKPSKKLNKTDKILIITACVLCFIYLIVSGIKIYRSDWFINHFTNVKSISERNLGEKVRFQYDVKYEHVHLYVKLIISNVDDKVMDMANKMLKDDSLVSLVLVNKENGIVKELKFATNEFKPDKNTKGTYIAEKSFKLKRRQMKAVKEIRPEYQKILDMNYEVLTRILEKAKK